jgi:hypothetical protein
MNNTIKTNQDFIKAFKNWVLENEKVLKPKLIYLDNKTFTECFHKHCRILNYTFSFKDLFIYPEKANEINLPGDELLCFTWNSYNFKKITNKSFKANKVYVDKSKKVCVLILLPRKEFRDGKDKYKYLDNSVPFLFVIIPSFVFINKDFDNLLVEELERCKNSNIDIDSRLIKQFKEKHKQSFQHFRSMQKIQTRYQRIDSEWVVDF